MVRRNQGVKKGHFWPIFGGYQQVLGGDSGLGPFFGTIFDNAREHYIMDCWGGAYRRPRRSVTGSGRYGPANIVGKKPNCGKRTSPRRSLAMAVIPKSSKKRRISCLKLLILRLFRIETDKRYKNNGDA